MFLKSLTIKGFKSFADTTRLDFEPGVTVVVGPNGSGKSNVVDAIAWVLGAQGPRTVRSQKMDDVVFAGTAKRAALGRAEVSMVLDNSSGILPIEFNEVTITRVLYRSGDSEYALNGVSCRLLDIQELLSDAGVGRQQHVIIAQGQIDQVLNARPEDRRTIIEEAAGILKYRRRKERAERRLDATEANLLRLQDLQREVRRQLRPLEQQADAARRHDAVVAELRALRLHLAGRELEERRRRLQAATAERSTLAEDDKRIRKELAEIDIAVLSAEAKLAAVGDDIGDALPRYESLAQRCRGLSALLAERRRGVERDRGAALADDLVASLEADRALARAQLADVSKQVELLAPRIDELEADEQALALEHHEFQSEREGFSPDNSGRAAEVRGELTAIRGSLDRAVRELDKIVARVATADQVDADRVAKASEIQTRLDQLAEAEPALAQRCQKAAVQLTDAEEGVAAAVDAERAASAGVERWRTRSEALRLALDEARAAAGFERIESLEGVIGTLADLVDVDAGFELAFEAAAGDAMASVVVADPATARAALDHLAEADLRGAVLSLGGSVSSPVKPSVGTRLRDHVRSGRAGADALLDRLFGSAVVVEGDWREAADVALDNPELLVVTRAGDRFGHSGWRIGAGGSGATAAAYEEAEAELATAIELAAQTAEVLKAARAALQSAQTESKAAARELELHGVETSKATDALSRVERQRSDAAAELQGIVERRAELEPQIERDRSRIAELEGVLPALVEREQSDRAQADEFEAKRGDLDRRARALASTRSELGVKAAGLDERREVLESRIADIGTRLEEHVREVAQAEARRERLDAQLAALDKLAGFVSQRQTTVDAELTRLREKRRRTSLATRAVADELDSLRQRRTALDRQLDELRGKQARFDVQEAELKMRLENLVAAIRNDLDTDPDTALAAPLPELAQGVTAPARVRDLERDLKRMGPVNPLAMQEYEALKERHEFVSEQLEDVRQGRRELSKVIRAIDEEITKIFAAAVADVKENFEQLFATLFPGGAGSLKLTDPTDLLNTGIELEARPSGKNVRKLSLLSGGERSLTALAFLFAIFRSRPSPFYVMDEVEAALDDVNLHRFLDLVAEFRREAQLIIVSHQKRTMEAADCLYGVTMPPGGSSRVVSEKVA
ncbi:MAG: chromosome segregation protein SMC [Acidimicrobiales bacterium]